ncbi:MAG: DUF1800 domain-containing protein [Pseudomonadota bacterium]|nr:DUF1800 domain-containing protein [Pseudomonadota bacterium]
MTDAQRLDGCSQSPAGADDEGIASTQLARLSVPLGGTALLTACGGGSSGSGSAGVAPTDLPASAAEAARFIQQASLASTSSDIAALQTLGYSAWLDQALAATPTSSNYGWLLAQGYAVAANQYSSSGIDAMAWRALIGEANPVRQRLALFWSEYFVVGAAGLNMAWPQFAAASYFDLLASHAVGNFRDLLKAVTLSPAMGEYLSLRGSVKADAATNRHPDENYAREVMQLFTIGLYQLQQDGSHVLSGGQPVASYGQADVTGLAAAFTGWEFNGSSSTPDYTNTPMVQIASRHDTAANTFLGATVPAGTTGEQALEIILDTLFNHPNLPPFLARQMIQRLITSNPSPAYIARVARSFVNDGSGARGNLLAVFKAVLFDSEARTAGAAGHGRVREPVLRMAQWGRTFAATSAGTWSIGDTSDPAYRLGQSPLRSPSVFNFFAPDYTPPGTTLAAAGLVAPELQLLDETSVAGYLNWMQHVIVSGAGDVTAPYGEQLAVAADATALVTHINLLLAAQQLDSASLALVTGAVAALPSATPANLLVRVHAAVLLVMAAPAYQVIK